jgi:hypothetical protein
MAGERYKAVLQAEISGEQKIQSFQRLRGERVFTLHPLQAIQWLSGILDLIVTTVKSHRATGLNTLPILPVFSSPANRDVAVGVL